MKTLLVTSFALIATFFNIDCFADYNPLEETKGLEIILTYPRSGTNLTLGVLQILSKKPVFSLNPKDEVNRLQLDLDQTKTPIWRTHSYRSLTKVDPHQNKLLIIVRNYKECIVRHQMAGKEETSAAEQLRKGVFTHSGGFRDYIDNLSFFEKWADDETKLIIFYEDLIKQPEIEFPKVFAFFNEEGVDFDEFFGNYDYWKEQILGSYQNQHGIQYSSGGDKEIFHSKGFPPEILKEIDFYIQRKYPVLWEKYLNRYATVD